MAARRDNVLTIVSKWLRAELRARRAGEGRPLCVGVSGPQGSGKTTLVGQLCREWAKCGRRMEALSLDDFYLSRAERRQRALDVHPLFVTRGVPGTHDTALLARVLEGLSAGEGARVPRFDKASDDRAPPGQWQCIDPGPIEVVVVEGWCLAVPPETGQDLREPVNDLERLEDAECRWRTAVNDYLASEYRQLFACLDRVVALFAPDFDVVRAWRLEQERELERGVLQRGGTTRALFLERGRLRRFLDHFQRLSCVARRELPGIADLSVYLDASRQPIRVGRRSPGGS